jgi:hypothetical protein
VLKVEPEAEGLTICGGGALNHENLMEAELTAEIIAAAIAVHPELWPDLLESAYRVCMCHDLALRKMPFRSQVELTDMRGLMRLRWTTRRRLIPEPCPGPLVSL